MMGIFGTTQNACQKITHLFLPKFSINNSISSSIDNNIEMAYKNQKLLDLTENTKYIINQSYKTIGINTVRFCLHS